MAATDTEGLRLRLIDNGYRLVECRGKRPQMDGWQRSTPTADAIHLWRPDTNTGLILGPQPDGSFLIAIDIDVADPMEALEVDAMVQDTLGHTPLLRIGHEPKRMLLYRLDKPIRKIKVGPIEVLAEGQQCIGFGIHPDTGQPYRWPTGESPESVALEDVPLTTLAAVNELTAWLASHFQERITPLSNGVAADPVTAGSLVPVSLTDDELVALSRNPGSWHEACRTLTGRWVAQGWPDSVIAVQAERLRWPEYTVAETARQLLQMTAGARRKGWAPPPAETPETPETTRDGLELIFWEDTGEPVRPDKLIKRLMGTTALAMVYGPPGSGKSFLATDIGLHIAMERDWFGRKVTKGAVLYIAAEGASGLLNRLIGFKRKHAPESNVPFVLAPATVNLGPRGQDADRVISAAETVVAHTGLPVLMIVVDTLARAMGGGDENTAQDMGAFINACDRIRTATGATVLIVHHTGKNENAGARGSSALLAAVDTAIAVEVGETGRIATVIKQKDGEDGVKFGFDLEVVEIGFDDDGEPITTCVIYGTETVSRAKSDLSPQLRRALDALQQAIAVRNVLPPNRLDFPYVSMTLLRHWRDNMRETGVTSRDNEASERKQWSRICQSLDQKGFIRMRGEYVWKCETLATKLETKK